MTTYIDRIAPERVAQALAVFRADTSQLAADVRETCGEDERFALWLVLADDYCVRAVGLSYRDLADWRWWDAYADGESPADAARQAIDAELADMM